MESDLEKYWQAYCKGNKRAFERVFILLFDPLFFKVLTLTEDRDAAKDIVQETLIKLYQKEDPSSIINIKSWTFKVAKNLFISEYRKGETKKKYQQYILGENQEASIPAYFPDEENFINLAKKHLSAGDFQLLQLEMQGYQVSEIATEMEMPEKTVYNRRTKIRKILAEVCKQVLVLLIMLYL